MMLRKSRHYDRLKALNKPKGEGAKARSCNEKGLKCWLLFLLFFFCVPAFGSFEERIDPTRKMNEGWTAFKNGEFQKSIDYWEEAAALYQKMDDAVEDYLRALTNLAVVYRYLEAHEEANQLLDEVLEYAVWERIEDRILLSFLMRDYEMFAVDPKGNELMLSGLVAFNNGWFLESILYWNQAAAFYDRVASGGAASGRGRVYVYLALVYRILGDERKKKQMIGKALKRAGQDDSSDTALLAILSFDQEKYAVDWVAHWAVIKGLMAFDDRRFEKSISRWEEAIEFYWAIGEDPELADNIRIFQAAAYKSMGKHKKAVELLEVVQERSNLFGPVERVVLPVLFDGYEQFAPNPADSVMEDGLTAFNDGRYRDSIQLWQQAVKRYDETDETIEGSVRARINLAAAYESVGEHKRAKQILQEALEIAESKGTPQEVLLVKSTLGTASIFSRQAPQAEPLLLESLELAFEENDAGSAASILNNLGNLYAGREDYKTALKNFEESRRLAERQGNTLLALRASVNIVYCLLEKGDDAALRSELDQLSQNVKSQLDEGYDKAHLLLSVGDVYYQLATRANSPDSTLFLEANAAFQEARNGAIQLKNGLLLSYADGYTGRLYEFAGRYEEALLATRSAEFQAQQVQMPDVLYRWQWQKGRLFAALGDNVSAVESYRNALSALQTIRHDIAIAFGNSNRNSSFRQELGALFYELADLLIQQSGQTSAEAESQAYLLEARDTIEQLKSAELEDYFQDDCVNLIRSKTAGVDAVLDKAAVLYFIPLKDRTELLLTLPSGLKRYPVPAGAEELNKSVAAFRNQLVIRTRHTYKHPAKKLYDLLIRPIEADLEAEGIETLVFIPDGALSTIPMAALHDGEQFLVEKYAVAITPGITLMNPQPIRRENLQVLVNGLSESVQGFPALPSVPYEVAEIKKNFSSTNFVDGAFLIKPVTEAFESAPYGIVHIASHGQFESEAKDSFLLTYDEKLTLDGLERLIRPSQFRGNPVELLTLSACQTAAGDDRAALGLAGVAIKAGARSAMATLWFVSDEASAKMVTSFYTHLKDPDISKAMALQQAQLELIEDPRFRHPRYWSPYLIIGNWL